MKLALRPPKKSLNKAYLKEKVSRADIERFKANFKTLVNRIDERESEEHLKNVVSDFLKDTWYKGFHEINTKDRKDLVIHTGRTTKEPVGVILEVKKPTNKAEMISEFKPNNKALHELILYYLKERTEHQNIDIKYLVATNIYEWFIFDEVWFDKHVFRNGKLKKEYESWKTSGHDTKFFYEQIAKPFIDSIEEEVACSYFNLADYSAVIRNDNSKDDNRLIVLYKILSPAHLLKQPFANDSNSLDTKFYSELLHILGLEEVKDGSKKVIRRKEKPDHASLLENTIAKLKDKESLRNVPNPNSFGQSPEERLYNVALELCITWINRILFLKLLEAQQLKYHKGDKQFLFLDTSRIYDFDELANLFFQVLAERSEKRRDDLSDKFSRVPYLNSSLFERTELERYTFDIGSLDNRLQLSLHPSTVLKDEKGKRKVGKLVTLQYLFAFLDAYDFSSEGGEEIQEENKSLINASVLGLIFEKINGYKDGSFFTPGFVTMYMCRETLRKAVLQKFKEAKGWDCESLDQLYDKIEDKQEANRIVNSITICDPAVGSGHFLVSALNEMINIKSELKILLDRQGRTLRDYHVEIVNDELIITDEEDHLFEYHPGNKESQRVQEALFHEKETIIEHCLFGVDINPNSVKICRLRLWIELLKHAYYTQESGFTQLETLPNIDINIKSGNSLASRFALDADISSALRSSKWGIDSYKLAVQTYREAESKEEKREMELLIETIKKDFRSYISPNDPKFKRLSKLRGELFNLSSKRELFGEDPKIKKEVKKDIERLSRQIDKLESEVEDIKNNKVYENAFEWRFEFPEVLDEEGNYVGFDVVIGNPPYMTGSNINTFKDFYKKNYVTAEYQLDLYVFFIELSFKILSFKGYVALITPNSWLKNLKMVECRKFILENFLINSIHPNIAKVFEEASVDTLIFIAAKSEEEHKEISISIREMRNNNSYLKRSISQSRFNGNQDYVFDVEVDEAKFQIMQKLRSDVQKMVDLFDITRGVNPYDAYRGQSQDVIKNRLYHSKTKKDSTFLPELRGKHVYKYGYKWDNQHYISYGNWLAAPREERFFRGERILFREILGDQTFICCYIKEDFIIDRSLYIALPKDEVNCKYVLGILASKLIAWFFRHDKNEFDDLFPKIRVEEFRNLPIKVANNQSDIINVVDKILAAKYQNPDADTSLLEKEIDIMVYKIYGLTYEEVKVVDDTVTVGEYNN